MKQSKLTVKHSKVGKWQCISNCGACCNLTPEERPDLEKYLSQEELETYLSMVGEDGWCINYDHDQRKCQIYEQRPRFCRVESANFESMFGIEPAEFNEFAIACCQQQIAGVYGQKSAELAKYKTAIFNNKLE
ncbi:MAG TPA: YkgJ family cysteine cluster protein [Coleofasciculaceae cyanobacterium]